MAQIKIVSVGEETTKQDKNGKAFSTIEVFYTVDGKARQKKVMTFSKEIYATCKNAKQGDTFELVQKKNGEFWDWVSLTPSTAQSSTGDSTSYATVERGPISTGSYGRETSEERAKRQVMIVRQSSISSAVDMLKGNGAVTVEAILDLAKDFEAYVLDFSVDLDNEVE